jgi:hypothetical protein
MLSFAAECAELSANVREQVEAQVQQMRRGGPVEKPNSRSN